MTDIKKCRNNLCGKLIYPHQKDLNGYCDRDCVDEVRHWKTAEALKRVNIPKIQTRYPHRLYPDTVLIID